MAGTEHQLAGLKINLGLDSADFTKGMGEISRRMASVKSEFNAASDGTKEWAKSLDGLKAKNDMLTRTLQVHEAKVAELNRRYEESKRTKGEDAAETQRLATQYNNAIGAMNRTRAQLTQVNEAIADHQNKAKKAQKALTEFGESAKGNGEKLSKYVTAPITAMGAAMLKVATDANNTSGIIQARLGATKNEADKLGASARDLWLKGFGENADAAGEAITRVKQIMSSLPDDQIKAVSKSALTLSSVFDYDVNDSTRAAKALMDNFGVSGTKAFDYITVAAQKGGDYSGELLDTISEYSVQFKSAGFSVDTMFNILVQGAKNGAFNLDKVGDAVKEFNLRAQDGSTTTAQGFKAIGLDANKMGEAISKGGNEGQKAFMATIAALAAMKDPVKQNIAGVNLFGTQWEDLRGSVVRSLNPTVDMLGNVEGATKRAGEATQKSFGAQLELTWRKAQQSLIPLGEELLKVANDALPKISSTIQTLTDKFSAMSPEAKKTILVIGGIAAVAGPVIMAIGSIAAGIATIIKVAGPVVGLLGRLAPAVGALGGAGAEVGLALGGAAAGAEGAGVALAALGGPVGVAILAVGALAFGMYKLNEAMQKPIISTQVFSDSISKSTQKALGSYLDLDKKATESLNNMAWSQQTITQQNADTLVGIYNDMNTKIIASMDKNHADQIKKTQDLFANNSALTAQEQAKVLADLDQDYTTRHQKEQDYQNKIVTIINTAKDQKRALTEEERQQIANIQDQMKTGAVQTMSKSEQEQLAILGNLRAESGIITAQQAADVVANSKKQRDKTVEHAQSQYQDTVAQITYMRDVTGSITDDQANRLIAAAKKQRDQSVSNANDMYNQVVASATKQAGEHANQVNWETGQVLTGWDNMYNGVIKAVNWIRSVFGLSALPLKGSVSYAASQPSFSQVHGGGGHAVSAYANGTSGHPGGLALVGDGIGSNAGSEAIMTPDGQLLFSPSIPTLMNLPKGTNVLSAKNTRKMFNAPRYANGIGDYFSTILQGAGAAWNLATSKIGLNNSVLPSWMANMTDYVGMIGSWGKDFLQKMIDSTFGIGGSSPAGSGVQRWTATVMQALSMNGLPTTADYVNAWLKQIQTESGGNAGAKQGIIDVNSFNGSGGAMGLVQVIPPTFNAYKFPGFGNIMNGLDNLLAGVSYAKNRYGASGMLSVIGHGHGYATGGFITSEQLALVGENNKQEVVIPLEQYRDKAKQLWIAAGQRLGMIKRSGNTYGSASISGAANSSSGNTYNFYPQKAIIDQKDVVRELQRMEALYG